MDGDHCPNCDSFSFQCYGNYLYKNDKGGYGKRQRYLCKKCGKTFSEGAGKKPESLQSRKRTKCIQLYLEGLPQKRIAEIVRMSKTDVNRLLKEFPGLEKYRLDRDYEQLTPDDWERSVVVLEEETHQKYSSGALYVGAQDHEIWGVRTKRKNRKSR